MSSALPDLHEQDPCRLQIRLLSDTREFDFSPLRTLERDQTSIDPVSIADILRNAFVYPPNSIYRHVQMAVSGLDPALHPNGPPALHFPFQAWMPGAKPSPGSVDSEALIGTYHQLLCEAVTRTTAGVQRPWLLQSGGKDSTSMAIAVSEVRPEVACITYLGGREENELASARWVAARLGLRHDVLVCDPGRAYDRYLALVPQIPLLTADFALLSYVDLVTEIQSNDGDGVIDALGSDLYFGLPAHWRHIAIRILARQIALPPAIFNIWGIRQSFRFCYALHTLQMSAFERFYPGSRFSDQEVDDLFGEPMAQRSRQRLQIFMPDIQAADSLAARRRLAAVIVEAASFGKGIYTSNALSLRLAYPYCDARLGEWIMREVPQDYLVGSGRANKVLVRKHIERHFLNLPYVQKKGCFRFDVCGLATLRFDQVRQFAIEAKEYGWLPGALPWLDAHRTRLENKYFASKFYLLAVVLPWLLNRVETPRYSSPSEHPFP